MKKIIEFQKNNNLTPDGDIGKKTLAKIKELLKVKTDEELANFMGQVATETGEFNADTENLNYSVDGLLRVFGKYFNSETAKQYARKPDAIANRVYANRMGNGNEASGDGAKYKGRGALQLTGKNNYKLFSDFIGEDCVKNPELVATKYYFESALFFFNNNNLWKIANKIDLDSITKLSKAINLGNPNSKATPHGLDERINFTRKFYTILKK